MREFLRLESNSLLTSWVYPFGDPTPYRVSEDDVVWARVDDEWSPFPSGTVLIGEVIFGANTRFPLSERRRAYIRFKTARLPDGRTAPVCIIAKSVHGADGAIIYGFDFIARGIDLAVVSRFDEGLGEGERH